MGRKRYTPEQIIRKLREVEVLISQGMKIPRAARQAGIVEQTYYRWRKEYGGMRIVSSKAPQGPGERESSVEETGSREGTGYSDLS